MEVLTRIQNLIKQRPEGVALLLKKHRFGAPVNNRNVGLGIALSPAFYQSLLKAVGGGDYDNATGPNEAERFTVAERLANAGIVFANVLQATSRQPEKFNQRLPAYYEPTGKYNVMQLPQRPMASPYGYGYDNRTIFGMDRRLAIGLGILLLILAYYHFNKK